MIILTVVGIGTLDTDCAMVKYQNEIDHFRHMYEKAMSMVPDRLLHPPKLPDTVRTDVSVPS